MCRRTGLWQELVEKQLHLGRINEAIAVTKDVSDYQLLSLADLFVKYGHPKIAEGFIWERAAQSKDSRLDEWLKNYAMANGDWATAVKYAESLFSTQPTVENYVALKELSLNLLFA